MSLADRMMARKKKRLVQKQEKLQRKLITVTEEYLKLEGDAPSRSEQPATRMTDEYLEFLKQQEAARTNNENFNEEV